MYLNVEASGGGVRARFAAEWSPPEDHEGWVAALYSQALAIERGAAARCRELAELLEGRGELAAAALFRKLARYEQHQANEIERQAAAPSRPRGREPARLEAVAPDRGLEGLVSPRTGLFDAIRIALGAPQRAKPLFERLARSARDAQLRALARSLAAQANEQTRVLRESLGDDLPLPVSS